MPTDADFEDDDELIIEDVSEYTPDKKLKGTIYKNKGAFHPHYKSIKTKESSKTKDVPYDREIPHGWEIPLRTPEIIRSYGFNVQIHKVATKDGYILSLHRIISKFALVVTNISKVVLFHHGIFGNSADWLIGGSESLPFLLARQGYDVWLANARGSIYSRSHLYHSIDSDEFWNFSFHEIGIYDLPPILIYIKSLTGYSSSLYFIGHSMGATAFLVTMSSLPKYNKLVRMAVFLAPLAFMQQTKGAMKILSHMDHRFIRQQLGLREVPMNSLLFRMLRKEFCELPKAICNNPLVYLSNGANTLLGTDTLNMILARRHSEGSTKTLIHYLQLLQNEMFMQFEDSGQELREYELEKVTVPLVVFTSNTDILVPSWDAVTLVMKIPNVLGHHTVNAEEFSHMDFVLGLNASKLLYQDIVSVLEAQEEWNNNYRG